MTRNRLLLLGLLAVAAGLAAARWGLPVATAINLPWPGAAAETPRYRTTVADRAAVTAAVSATGTVNPRVTVSVGSQLSGQIRELLADFNTRVIPGQPIARLDMQQLEAKRAAAIADLEAADVAIAVARATAEKTQADALSARAQVVSAEAQLSAMDATLRDSQYEARRTEELRRGGTGAARDAVRAGYGEERARANVAQMRAQLAQTQAAEVGAAAASRIAIAQVAAAEAARSQKAALLKQVEVDLGFMTIRSPIEGVVISRNVDLGQTVAASFQAPVLFQIAANLDEMEVHATVDEADIGRISDGQEVPFTVAAYPGETITGRVKETRLAAATVSNVVTYTVVITVPNRAGRLLPGMTATLRIITDHRPNALRVPNAALRWRPQAVGAAAAEAPAAGSAGAALDQALAQLEDLTDAQREEIAAARAEFRERLAQPPGGPPSPGAFEARFQNQATARQRLLARINGILTAEQRARLAEVRGSRGAAGRVWVLDETGEPREVPVRLGVSDGSFTEITAGGLRPGMAVIVGLERAGRT